jgi:hypothetical protein
MWLEGHQTIDLELHLGPDPAPRVTRTTDQDVVVENVRPIMQQNPVVEETESFNQPGI